MVFFLFPLIYKDSGLQGALSFSDILDKSLNFKMQNKRKQSIEPLFVQDMVSGSFARQNR